MRKGGCILVVFAWVWAIPVQTLAQDTLEEIRFNVERFEVIGDNPIGTRANAILAPFVGEQYGLEGLSAARDALEQAIINSGFNFHRVSLPPQDLFEGSVTLKVSSFAIGNIVVEGNKFFNRENILRTVPELVSGGTPNTQELSRSLRIANSHASKSTVLRFKEGTENDSIDAVLAVKDRNPQVFFVTLDNTGSEKTEVYRSTFGYQNGNLFNKDHALTATFTTAPEDTDTTAQFGLNYRIPMYRHGASLDLLFSDSDSAGSIGGESGQSVAPGTPVGEALEITGKGTVVGAVYNRPMLTDSSYKHQWSLGLQHKTFNNQSGFGFIDYEVLSVPLELGYRFNRQTPGSNFSGSLSLIQEIGDDNKEYDSDRPEGESGWSALRYSLTYDHLISEEWLFHFGLSGQSSSNLLISGEQFGVGGAGTLRGFEERSVTGDSGYQFSLELWMPPVTSYKLRFSVFADFAHTEFNDGNTPGNEGVAYDLDSAGVSMFWSWRENLSVALDYGVIGKGGGPDTSINRDGDDKLHMSLVYRF